MTQLVDSPAEVPAYAGLPPSVMAVVEDLFAGRRPNQVHAFITHHRDGETGRFIKPWIEDLGLSENLRVNEGNDWQARAMGVVSNAGVGTPATSTTATSLTNTGASWTVDAWIGYIVVAGSVFGRINDNTATVLTVDAWLNADGTAGSTPAGTSAYVIVPGSGTAVFIALTTDTGAPAAGDTVLTSEITTNGLERAIASYAHTNDAANYTLTKVFTASGTHTAVHKAGCFTNLLAGIMVFETNLSADATLQTSDTLTVTWTVNI